MSEKLEKSLDSNYRIILQNALNKNALSLGLQSYCYIDDIDKDNGVFYVCSYDCDDGCYSTYKLAFTVNEAGTSATISGKPVKVLRMSDYVEIESTEQKESLIQKVLGVFKKEETKGLVPVIKAFDEEKMVAIEPLYIAPNEVDGHNMTADADVLRQLADELQKGLDENRIDFKYDHGESTKDFSIVKAFVSEFDCEVAGEFIPEGQPLAKVQFHSKEAWEKRKNGEILGLSIGAHGEWEEVEE